MNPRLAQPQYARNKNMLVIGGSGSGKTRFVLKPNLMQCRSKDYPVSFVVTDPKGLYKASRVYDAYGNYQGAFDGNNYRDNYGNFRGSVSSGYSRDTSGNATGRIDGNKYRDIYGNLKFTFDD